MAGQLIHAMGPTFRRRTHRRERSHRRHSAYREVAMTFPEGASGCAKTAGWWLLGAAGLGLVVFFSFAAQKDHELFRASLRLFGF